MGALTTHSVQQARPTWMPPVVAGVAASPVGLRLVLATAYLVAVLMGRLTQPADVALTVLWPPVAIATIWIAQAWGQRRTLLLDSAALAGLAGLVSLASGEPLTLAAAACAATVAHALTACAVYTRTSGTRWALQDVGDLRALLLAVAAASSVGAGLSTAAAAATGVDDLAGAALALAVRNGVSTLLLVGLALRLAGPPSTASPPRRAAEAMLILSFAGLSYALSVAASAASVVALTVLPLAAWAALRLSTTAAVALTVGNAVPVVLVSVYLQTPMIKGGAVERLFISQAFLVVTMLLAMVLALHRDERAGLIGRLQESEQRFRLAFSTAPTGLCMLGLGHDTDDVGVVRGANAALADFLGVADPLALERTTLLARCAEPELLAVDLERAAATGAFAAAERAFVHTAGHVVWGQCAGAVVRPDSGAPYVMLLVTDATERRQVQTELLHRSRHDPLTGLANRVVLEEHLTELLSSGQADRSGLLFLDLDGFKQVNDRAGHLAGDLVLQRVAARLRWAVRPSDLVVRLGGDEFAVVCAEVDEPELMTVAQRVVEAIADLTTVGELLPPVTASVGATLCAGPGVEDVLRLADQAMYDAKRAGKDRAVRAALPSQVRRRAEQAGGRPTP